jgi:hypothetical protein
LSPLWAEIGASRAVGNVLSWLARLGGRLSALDWVLIAAAVLLAAWGWVRAAAFARLGSIEIEDVAADGDAAVPIALKADLQQGLGTRGLLPPSGVPSGSPTRADLSSAVASAPVPQAAWIGALINLIPFPAASTSFKLSTTAVIDDGNADGRLGLVYQLVCTGPTPKVTLDQARGDTWPAVVDLAVKDIYRAIAEAAPDIYPRWARWASSEALTSFRDGLDAEQGHSVIGAGVLPATPLERLEAACELYRQASDRDPDNMLARLRAANCLERSASEKDGAAQRARLVDALEEYISIRLRQPEIFEAGYRASVLLSNIANDPEVGGDQAVRPRLEDIVDRLEKARKDITQPWWTRAWRGVKRLFRRPSVLTHGADPLLASVERAAVRESRRARWRLAPWWALISEHRFRHRFEPTGSRRRQLRKALRISKLCIKARRAQPRSAWYLFRAQLWWRTVIAFSMGGRPYGAGWQADYNAACFYALLLGAPRITFGRGRIERLAFIHLRRAVEQSDHELQCRFVRDEDPDLGTLRGKKEFKLALGAICPDELVVHVSRAAGEGGRDWTLHAWGDAIAPSQAPTWAEPLRSSSQSEQELLFRVRIFDENKPVNLMLHDGDHKGQPEWLIPPIPKTREVWLYLEDAEIHRLQPAHWLEPAVAEG